MTIKESIALWATFSDCGQAVKNDAAYRVCKTPWVGKISYLFTFFDPLDLTLYDSLTNGFLEIGKRIINFHYLTDFLAVTNGALLFNSSIVLDGFSTSEDSFDFSQPVSIIRDNKKQMFSVPSFYIYIGVCFLSSSSNGFFYLNSENGEVYLYKNESRSGIIVKKWSSFRELLDYIHAIFDPMYDKKGKSLIFGKQGEPLPNVNYFKI